VSTFHVYTLQEVGDIVIAVSIGHDIVSMITRIRLVSLVDLCSDLGKPRIPTRYMSRAYLPPLASNTLLVPSRLAFLQRSASGTVLPAA